MFVCLFWLAIVVSFSDPNLSFRHSLVKHNQKAYQEDLVEGFEDVKKKLFPYVAEGANDTFKS